MAGNLFAQLVFFAAFSATLDPRLATVCRFSRWRSDFLLQSLQRAQYQLSSELFFFVWRQFGIARRADDAAGGNGAQRADFFGDGDHRADLRHGNFQFFDFFADRCAAASARASSRCEDHAGDAGGFQLIGDLPADLHGVLHCGVGAAGGVDELMHFTNDAFALEGAHGIERH